MDVSRERLHADIESNAEFGELDVEAGRGRTVLTGSDADERARDRFVSELRAADLDVRIDAVGNVAGRWVPDGVDPDAPPVALGSHLDSVPQGGIFDGPLGVYAALESVRAIQASDRTLSRPLEVVSFTVEEGGRFGVGTLGSSVACGERTVEHALGLEDDDGTTLREALDGIDYRGNDAIDPHGWDAWLELHIEQGTRLEDAGADVGVVDGIVGIANCDVAFVGTADHAGSTPMNERSDALTAASEFVSAVERAGRELAMDSPATVATVGELTVEPNARNIVPGRVEMRMDVRDTAQEGMDAVIDRARLSQRRIANERGIEGTFDHYRNTPPSQMSERCIDAVEAATSACDATGMTFHSAAMHDTANVTEVTDAGLLFAPSRDGVSHNPREWTDWDDCATATRVLAEAAATLADGGR